MRTFSLLISAVFTLSACGDNFALKPGPILSEVIKEREKANPQVVKKAELCGEPVQEKNNDENAVVELPVYALDMKIEPIKDGDTERTAIALEGKRFNFRNAGRTLEAKTQLLAASKISDSSNVVSLEPKINDIEKPPIIIRVNCFNIEEDEVLETQGRDLFIFADVVTINGTIRTTPATREDYPGENGGDILIYAIKANFGPKAILDAKGGDAGKITSEPGIVFTDDPKDASIKAEKVQEIRSKLVKQVVSTKLPDLVNPADPEQIAQLIESYERYRKNLIIGNIEGAENALLDILILHSPATEKERLEYFKRDLSKASTKASRELILQTYNSDWVSAWTKAADLSMTNISEDPDNIDWLIPNKLSVLVDNILTQEVLATDKNGESIYYREVVKFEDLKGGFQGVIRIFAADGNEWENDGQINQMGSDVKGIVRPAWIYLVDGKESFPALDLYKVVDRKFLFRSRKDVDDKISGSAEGEYSIRKLHERSQKYRIEDLDMRATVKAHRHNKLPVRKKERSPQKKYSRGALLDGISSSGAKYAMPSYSELKVEK